MVQIHNVQQNSEEWHELRKGKITASNAYILLQKGKNAARSANDSESSGGFYAKRGHILEDQAIEIYEDVKNLKVKRIGFITNDKYQGCGYSPDGDHVEVKCFKEEKHLESMERLPNEVHCQVQFGMMIAEWDYVDVILYNPDMEDDRLCFKVIRVEKDQNIIDSLEAKL